MQSATKQSFNLLQLLDFLYHEGCFWIAVSTTVALAIFDLDNTLLAGDSDYLWGQYLCENNIVDGEAYSKKNTWYYEEYLAGRLDIMEFLNFALHPLSLFTPEQLLEWRDDFFTRSIRPRISAQAQALVEQHRAAGDTLLVITATNSFVSAPVVAAFGIDNLIATEPEMTNGRYTGRVAGVPSFREGKVERLNQWLQNTGHSMQGSWFYSDSHNDLPLLHLVSHPVAVDPDDELLRVASAKGWPVLHLHQ